MACYFGTFNGAEQLAFVLNFKQQTAKGFTEHADRNSDLSILSFNSISGLFRSDSDLNHYSELIKALMTLKLSGIEQQAILAYIILFDYDSTMNLKEAPTLSDINVFNDIFFDSCVDRSCSTFSLKDLSRVLVRMAVFSAYNIDWSDSPFKRENICTNVIDLQYSQEEELWLETQVQLIETAFRSVPIGEHILEEFTMVSLCVPVSKNFLKECFEVGKERCWRMFFTQQEFVDLPTSSQLEIKSCHLFSILTLMTARTESFSCGTEQLKYCFAQEDEENWTKKFQRIFGKTKMQTVGLLDISANLPFFQSEENKKLDYLRDAKTLSKDRTLWGLMMLLKLTEPLPSSKSLIEVHSKYKLLLCRRLRWICSKRGRKQHQHIPDHTSSEDRISKDITDHISSEVCIPNVIRQQDIPDHVISEDCISKVMKTLNNIEELASFLLCMTQTMN
jgi:hypothetical protein